MSAYTSGKDFFYTRVPTFFKQVGPPIEPSHGSAEHVTVPGKEHGYTVARFKAPSTNLITLVDNFPDIHAGQTPGRGRYLLPRKAKLNRDRPASVYISMRCMSRRSPKVNDTLPTASWRQTARLCG
jgi:hypothetical protein